MTTARARNTDAASSHAAAVDVEARGIAPGQREQVRRGLFRFGACGITSAELADRIGMERHKVARRLPELRDNGQAWVQILDVGTRSVCYIDEQRKCSATGRASKVWRPVAPRARDLR